MKRMLHSFNEYSNGIIAISTCLTTIATILICFVAYKQTKLVSIMGKSAERPVIEIEYINEGLGMFVRRNNRGDMAGESIEIRTIRLTNTGRGSARKLKIEFYGFRGKKTKEMKERELRFERAELELAVGQKHEFFIYRKQIESGEFSSFVKVTYQDIFGNEYIRDI